MSKHQVKLTIDGEVVGHGEIYIPNGKIGDGEYLEIKATIEDEDLIKAIRGDHTAYSIATDQIINDRPLYKVPVVDIPNHVRDMIPDEIKRNIFDDPDVLEASNDSTDASSRGSTRPPFKR